MSDNIEPIERRAADQLLHQKLDAHILIEEGRLERIESEIKEIKDSTKGLLDAWNSANTIGNFLKWVAGIGAGVVVIIEAIRHFGKG